MSQPTSKQYKLPLDDNLTYFANEFLEEKGYQFNNSSFSMTLEIDAIMQAIAS